MKKTTLIFKYLCYMNHIELTQYIDNIYSDLTWCINITSDKIKVNKSDTGFKFYTTTKYNTFINNTFLFNVGEYGLSLAGHYTNIEYNEVLNILFGTIPKQFLTKIKIESYLNK